MTLDVDPVRAAKAARALRCDCPDATYNGAKACKHALAVVLAAGLNGRTA